MQAKKIFLFSPMRAVRVRSDGSGRSVLPGREAAGMPGVCVAKESVHGKASGGGRPGTESMQPLS